jgi:enamine deaminase RidA (YjgF/YER057c/UK114 family)
MPRKVVAVKGLETPMGPYSQCIVGLGKQFLFISGQVSQDAKGNLVGKGDIEKQTRQVLANQKIAVEAAGGTVADICKITIFVAGLDEAAYRVIGQCRREFFGKEFPASTMVEVKRLASPDWLIEIEAYALI